MAKRMLFLGFIVAISAFAHAAPGVWEKMQLEQMTHIRGVVKSVELAGTDIGFTVKTKDAFGDDSEVEMRLCGIHDNQDNRVSEEVRAALLKSKIEVLEESRRTGKAIEFGAGNPWVRCVSTLRSLEG